MPNSLFCNISRRTVAPSSLSIVRNCNRIHRICSLSTAIPLLLLPSTIANFDTKTIDMPRSISSSHSRTATNSSSQHGSSYSSTKPPSARSATGSFSTINSGPFIHADDLDTTIQWIPSYYLDDVPPQQSPVGSPRRNALVPDTPTSSVLSSAFSSKVSLLPHGLMHLIRTSELERPTKEMFLATVRMMVYISHQLFPPSHILRKDVAHDIENIAQDICEFLDLVQDKLQERLDAANSANAKLPDNELQDEVPLEEVIRWVDIIE